MTLKSKPYYWVECDGTDCKSRCPGGDYEVTAWDGSDQAVADATDSDWLITDTGEHYCLNCWGHNDDDEAVPLKALS